MNLLAQIVLPVFFFWCFGLLLVLFRRDLETIWKVIFVLIFAFYCFQFYPEISLSMERVKQDPYQSLLEWGYGLGKALYFFLFLVWPISLIRMFYSASGNLSRSIVVSLVLFTVIYWVGFFLWGIFSQDIQKLLGG